MAQGNFDIFTTLDKGFRYQQNLAGRTIAILVVRAESNRLADLIPHARSCLKAMATIKPGEIVQIGSE